MTQKNPGARPELELTVGEVATRSGVAVSTLHFYETKGLIQSRRNRGNQRRYPRVVLRRVAVIKVAQKTGIPLADIAEALSVLPHDRPLTAKDWQRLSQTWKHQARRADSQPHGTARPPDRLHRLRLPVDAGLPAQKPAGRARRKGARADLAGDGRAGGCRLIARIGLA